MTPKKKNKASFNQKNQDDKIRRLKQSIRKSLKE